MDFVSEVLRLMAARSGLMKTKSDVATGKWDVVLTRSDPVETM